MRHSDWRLRAQDILDAIAEIQLFIDGIEFEVFQSDLKILRAVEYNFVVMGEAARNIPDELKDKYRLLPWQRMIAMRNMVAHQYRRIIPSLLWDTIQDDLPPVISLLREMLERES